MKKYLKDTQGISLVEILAALVLLSIVLVTFMTFFTQSAKFTAHNHETLTSVQVAEQVVAEVRTGAFTASDIIEVAEYDVQIIIEESPKTLKKATIIVMTANNEGTARPKFETHMYFEDPS